MALKRERGLPGAVLIDKDGTLLDDVPYNVDPARMRLAPGAARALRTLGATGMPIVVVSNQPGVALGRFTENELGAVRRCLAELFEANGATLADFFSARITRAAACRLIRLTASAASRAPACCVARWPRWASSPNGAG